MVATGRPGFQAAVARAYNSRFGLGGGAYHGEQAHEGPAESAYMGIMRAVGDRRDRWLRRDAAARRGLGAQLPPPHGRPPGLARPAAAGQLLAAQHLGEAGPPVLRDRHLARRAGSPTRRAQPAAVLRPAGAGHRDRALAAADSVPRDRADLRMAGLGALAGLPRPDRLPRAAARRAAVTSSGSFADRARLALVHRDDAPELGTRIPGRASSAAREDAVDTSRTESGSTYASARQPAGVDHARTTRSPAPPSSCGREPLSPGPAPAPRSPDDAPPPRGSRRAARRASARRDRAPRPAGRSRSRAGPRCSARGRA